jgi:hypothetical protein
LKERPSSKTTQSCLGHKKRKVSIAALSQEGVHHDRYITPNQKGRTVRPILRLSQESQQFKALIGEGNQAYVDNDPAEAIRVMQEDIRIEPRASAA